jgi:hypothetical protein
MIEINYYYNKSNNEHLENCRFSGVTVGSNETVRIEVDPADTNLSGIKFARCLWSSIYAIPPEIFTKFPNLETLWAPGQNIQEIKADTLANAKNLEEIWLLGNKISVLHKDTFRGAMNLKMISLSRNKLTFLHMDIFKGGNFYFLTSLLKN